MRVAAVGDLHCGRDGRGRFSDLFAEASAAADAIVLCGDLTDYGMPDEARVLAGELAAASVPIIGVLGNHDYESGAAPEVASILEDAGVHVLDGEAVEVGEIGFAGTKGFAGGFGSHALGAWGEAVLKSFVQEAMNEGLRLETGLARLRTPTRVAVLHYSPILETVTGEPPEIYAWLGSSRLEDPIDRYAPDAVFHGHAHYGALEGRTRGGVPVYNVSEPLLRQHLGRSFRVVELAQSSEGD